MMVSRPGGCGPERYEVPVVRYRLDPDRSRVWIEATSSLHPIRSETLGVEGSFEAEMSDDGRINPSVATRARIELPVRNLSSGNPLLDREMQRRIAARTYPHISGVLTAMKQVGDDRRYLVTGDVTFRGVTKAVEDAMHVTAPDDRTLLLEGQHVFDIRDFGMDPPRILTLRVHPEVTVRVALLATRED